MEGNRQKMREALVKIRDIIIGGGFDGRSPAHIVNICDAAISAPARQCDVGTAEEQERRYKATGEAYHTSTLTDALAWAQTPHEAKEGGAE